MFTFDCRGDFRKDEAALVRRGPRVPQGPILGWELIRIKWTWQNGFRASSGKTTRQKDRAGTWQNGFRASSAKPPVGRIEQGLDRTEFRASSGKNHPSEGSNIPLDHLTQVEIRLPRGAGVSPAGRTQAGRLHHRDAFSLLGFWIISRASTAALRTCQCPQFRSAPERERQPARRGPSAPWPWRRRCEPPSPCQPTNPREPQCRSLLVRQCAAGALAKLGETATAPPGSCGTAQKPGCVRAGKRRVRIGEHRSGSQARSLSK